MLRLTRGDTFFTKHTCDRCHGSLHEGRILSMYTEECICMKCKKEETRRQDYKQARDRELEEVKKGNYNYKGIEG